MYDAIVVGARCAGSPTAMLLARKGYRVLLVDRASFPSDTISGHYIHQPGVAALKRWGLLECVAATGCPPIRKFTSSRPDITLSGSPPPADGDVNEGYCPRRYIIDKILVDAAVESGVELRENFSMKALIYDGDQVTGVHAETKTGGLLTEQARITIGADGFRSRVAQHAKAPAYNEQPTLTFAYASYWSGVPVDGLNFFDIVDGVIGVLPTNDNLTLIFTQQPIARFAEFKANKEANFYSTLDNVPAFAERVRQGKREERWMGMADMPNFFRRPYGDGWALVGDAGYHKDPITALGMTDAFLDAESLAAAIDDAFSGHRPIEDALAEYEAQRNQRVMPLYAMTVQRARLEASSPEMLALLRALQGNQADTNRFLGLVAGTTPFAEFMAPENIQRIIAEAA
jgi:2-polyprenyl-6-methoxyphenol hydroxylase-like FAD-dependent oxidoreductase